MRRTRLSRSSSVYSADCYCRSNFQEASLAQVGQNVQSQGQHHAVHADACSPSQQDFPLSHTFTEARNNECIVKELGLMAPLSYSKPMSQARLYFEPPLTTAQDQSETFEHITSKLYPSQQLGSTLKTCFDELELFYPCIDRRDFYSRLSDLFLLHSTCQARSTQIPVTAENLSLAALTCMLLAIGTYLGSAGPSDTSRLSTTDDYFRQASLSWYSESTMLLDQFDCSKHPNIDLLRLHMMEVIYMTMLDRKGGVFRCMALAVDLAYSLGINNEQTWSSYTVREKEYHRLLWWTLCYMDRRIALDSQRPILLKDPDVDVGDFTEDSFQQYMEDASYDKYQTGTHANPVRLSWPSPCKPPENYFDWLLFCMRWSKVVAQIWDTTFALKAFQATVDSIAMADMLLMDIHRTLPPSLGWNVEYLPRSIITGEVDRACRLKVIVFEVRTLFARSKLSTMNAKKSIRPQLCYVCRSGLLG